LLTGGSSVGSMASRLLGDIDGLATLLTILRLLLSSVLSRYYSLPRRLIKYNDKEELGGGLKRQR
jgi:hypothetical protein